MPASEADKERKYQQAVREYGVWNVPPLFWDEKRGDWTSLPPIQVKYAS